MRKIKPILFCAFFYCLTNSMTAQVISVDDTRTAQQLIENVLINSSCANVSNFSVNGDPFSGVDKSYGSFNNQGGSFPFGSGIILNTWSIKKSIGPYTSGVAGGGSKSWLGDADLDNILAIKSINATVLEFDFVPLTNYISFNYIFASNEYQSNYPCDYSDGFAFLIKEKGSLLDYENLAVLPNSTTAVSSKNVHPLINSITDSFGTSYPGCPPVNESYFDKFNTTASPINYSGQTKTMQASSAVKAGVTYHIKLVIADDDNVEYDSAVFLEAGSFSSKIDLGMDRLFATNNPICYGETTVLDTKLSASLGYTYKWYRNNVLQPQNTPSFTVTGPGTYRVDVELGSASCTTSDEVVIEYTADIVLINSTLVQCDENADGISLFNLTKADAVITNNDTSLNISYFETLADATANTNGIANPTSYTNKTPNQKLFARVTNAFGCEKYAELDLQISNTNIAPQKPFPTCDGDAIQDGFYHFDLNTQVTPTVLQGLSPGLTVEYYLNYANAITQTNPLPNIYNNATANQQIIYARIVIGTDCYDIAPITLVVNTFSPPNFQDEKQPLCSGNTVNLAVANSYTSYLWSTGETTNAITVAAVGDYTVTVTDSNGCEATKKFSISASEIGTITAATTTNFAGDDNSITLEYIGSGDYEFSLDGSYYQDSPTFTTLAPGEYLAYARDKNGCGVSSPYTVYVIDYPRFFTPNGDGFNDQWHIKNLDLLTKSILTIYDRYGKLLKQLGTKSAGWNGTFNGYQLPADDYWFNLRFDDGKIVKGHFSLKR